MLGAVARDGVVDDMARDVEFLEKIAAVALPKIGDRIAVENEIDRLRACLVEVIEKLTQLVQTRSGKFGDGNAGRQRLRRPDDIVGANDMTKNKKEKEKERK
jgi:hypothetical protein